MDKTEEDMIRKSAIARDVLAEKLRDAAIPGFLAECSPEEAEAMGAFMEETMDIDDAIAASFDPVESQTGKDDDHA